MLTAINKEPNGQSTNDMISLLDVIVKSDNYQSRCKNGDMLVKDIIEMNKEIEKLTSKLNKFKDWYDRDGSVGGLSQLMDELMPQTEDGKYIFTNWR